MVIRDKVLGIITLISDTPGRHFTETDELIATELARKAAIAIEDAQLYNETKKLNAGLEERVKKRTLQLEKANEELESFSYSVSHDLRAPLRAILGYTNLLLDDHADDLNEEGANFLEILREESTRMGELIDDLLAFSRMSRKEKQFIHCRMRDVIDEAMKEIGHTYDTKNYTLNIADLPAIKMDPKLMKQVWINLIGNAISYKKPNKKAVININVEELDKTFKLSISDNGIGFDEKYSAKIFGVFERLHHNSEIKGTGIGLALVKRIIGRHDGEVWVNSTPGSGTTFFLSLPKELEQ